MTESKRQLAVTVFLSMLATLVIATVIGGAAFFRARIDAQDQYIGTLYRQVENLGGKPAGPPPDGKPGSPGKDSTVPGPVGPSGPPGRPGRDSTVPGPIGKTGPAPACAKLVNACRGDRGLPGAASTIPGPQGDAGKPGADSTVPGPQGEPGKDSTVPGPQGEPGKPGADSTVPGPQGEQGIPGPAGPTCPGGEPPVIKTVLTTDQPITGEKVFTCPVG